MKYLPIPVLKGCSCVGASLCRLCVLWLLWQSWMRSEHGSHLPLGCDAVIILLGGGTGDGGTEARTGCELGSSYSQWLPPSSSGWRKVLRCWVRFELVLFSLGVHFPLSWQQHLYPRGELCWSWKGLIGCLVWARAGTGMVLAQQSEFESF